MTRLVVVRADLPGERIGILRGTHRNAVWGGRPSDAAPRYYRNVAHSHSAFPFSPTGLGATEHRTPGETSSEFAPVPSPVSAALPPRESQHISNEAPAGEFGITTI